MDTKIQQTEEMYEEKEGFKIDVEKRHKNLAAWRLIDFLVIHQKMHCTISSNGLKMHAHTDTINSFQYTRNISITYTSENI